MPPPPTDLFGDRTRVTDLGILAVVVSCAVFTASRAVVQWTSGAATPWWGNLAGLIAMLLVWSWYRRDPPRHALLAAQLTGLIALLALLPPVAYAMPSTLWWVSLVGFSMVLLASRREGAIWGSVVVATILAAAAVEPHVQVAGAAGETPLERTLARVVFAVILMGIALGFRIEIERRTAQLQRTADELAEASAAKTRFLGQISHELRNPLHSVIAMTDLALRDTTLDGEARHHVRTARSSARVLLRLLNDTLDVARADGHSLALDEQPFDLHVLVADTVRPYTYQARERGIAIVALADAGIPKRRIGDAARIAQLLMNLVTNALKFTDTGWVEIRLEADAGIAVRLVVEDTGRGVPESDRERIFQPFEQLRATDASRAGGAGLGLAISRELARRMGGSLVLETGREGGARFVTTLPLAVVEEEPGPTGLLELADARLEEPTASTTPCTVLVVDDDPTNRVVLDAMLRHLAHRPVGVPDGQSALAALEQSPVDLVITDVQMPGMDGLELLRRIRADPRFEALPVVLCSAAETGQADYSDTAASAFLAKPFELRQVSVLLEKLLH